MGVITNSLHIHTVVLIITVKLSRFLKQRAVREEMQKTRGMSTPPASYTAQLYENRFNLPVKISAGIHIEFHAIIFFSFTFNKLIVYYFQ